MRESRGVYRALVGRLEGKRPLGRPRRRWENNIKMDLQEVVRVWIKSRWLRISAKNQTENTFQYFVIGNPILLPM